MTEQLIEEETRFSSFKSLILIIRFQKKDQLMCSLLMGRVTNSSITLLKISKCSVPSAGKRAAWHLKKTVGIIFVPYEKVTDLSLFSLVIILVLKADNSYEILIDQMVVNTGNLLSDMTPPVNPPREIEDPNDQKPEDWDERAKIPDPDAVKPDDW